MQDNTETVDNKPAFIDYEYGDLYIKCSCGHEAPIKQGKSIKGGLRFELYTIDTSTLSIHCDKCGTTLTLLFKEAEDIFKLKEEDRLRDELINKSILEAVEEAQLVNEVNEEDGNNESV